MSRGKTGPVIVIHEVPGLTPEVIGFVEEFVDAGHTVVPPHLFGGRQQEALDRILAFFRERLH